MQDDLLLSEEENHKRNCLARWFLDMEPQTRKYHWANMKLRHTKAFMEDIRRRAVAIKETRGGSQ